MAWFISETFSFLLRDILLFQEVSRASLLQILSNLSADFIKHSDTTNHILAIKT